MTREEYIIYRINKNYVEIIKAYMIEIGFPDIGGNFAPVMEQWLNSLVNENLKKGVLVTKQAVFQRMVDYCIDHYNIKFEIVEITVEKEETVKKKITFII